MQHLKEIISKYRMICEISIDLLVSTAMCLLFGVMRSKEFFLAALLMISSCVVVHFGIKHANARRVKFALWLSVPFSACFELGELIVYDNISIRSVNFFDIYIFIMLCIFFMFANVCVMNFIDKHRILVKKKNKETQDKKNKWLVYSSIMFISWLLMFLIFFPGFISVDSAVQIKQAIGEGGLSNWHPVAHTLLLSIFIRIGEGVFGSLTAGIAVYVIAQMTIVAIIYGYIVKWSIEYSGKKWIGILLLIFFSTNHVIICYSITIWKDILFSSVFLLLILKVYDFIKNNKKNEYINYKNIWLIILLSIFVAFLRNGGILITITLGIGLLVYYEASRKKILLSFLGATTFILIIQGPIYSMLGITGSPFMESMSVPAQQIGYVASIGGLNEDEKTKLSDYVDIDRIALEYSPMNADYAKNCFDYNKVNEDKINFLLMWASMIPDHFGSFVKAYILHTYSYWYVQGVDWTLDMTHTHDDKWLSAEYEDIAIFGEQARRYATKAEVALTTMVFSGWINNVGVLCWGIIYITVLFLYQHKRKMLIVLSCVLIYIVSLLLASPVSWMFRYIYVLLLSLPVFVVILFCDDSVVAAKKKKQKNVHILSGAKK